MKVSKKTVVFGAGAMGGALLRGWIKSRILTPGKVTVVDMDQAKCKALATQLKVRVGVDPTKDLRRAEVVLVAVKPQQIKILFEQIGKDVPSKTLVLSIAAGISTDQLEAYLPQGCPVVRIMPNTPALLGAGMAAVTGGQRSKPSHVKLAISLFASVGKAVEVRESMMDLVTGLSGSGPAYVFRMIEGMVEAGVRGGLPNEIALELAAQTVYGAGRMVLETGKSPTDLRVQVTSPGGTTAAGLKVMDDNRFKETVEAAVEAAARRGAELRKMV